MKLYFTSLIIILFAPSLFSQTRSYIIKPNKDTLNVEGAYLSETQTLVNIKINGKDKRYYADSIFKYSNFGVDYQSIKLGKTWGLMQILEEGELIVYSYATLDRIFVKTDKQGYDEAISCFVKDLKKFTNLNCQSLFDSLRKDASWDITVTDLIKKYNKTCRERKK